MEKENALEKAFAQIKETVKADTEKIAAPKETAKAVKKAAAAKTKKTEAAVKETAKKTPAKKTPAKKTPAKATEKTIKTAVTFEFNGKQLLARDILDQAMQAYRETDKDTEIESFELYIVANEDAAYYVVNGVGSDQYKISL